MVNNHISLPCKRTSEVLQIQVKHSLSQRCFISQQVVYLYRFVQISFTHFAFRRYFDLNHSVIVVPVFLHLLDLPLEFSKQLVGRVEEHFVCKEEQNVTQKPLHVALDDVVEQCAVSHYAQCGCVATYMS